LTRELLIDNPGVAVIGIDARAHGNSPGDVSDLSVDCLISDFVSVVESIRRKWSTQHHIFLAGHSLGGSIICRVASQELLPGVAGIVVIDIVEEAALSALRSMPAVLARRPSSFATLEDAILWAVLSRTSHDVESASISIPDQLAEVDGRWVWKVDLIKCNQWWDGWFRGLSQYFVDCPVPRVLVLAEREYLDRTLMIASMQGKFQNTIIRNCGHAVQEDQPNQLAQVISSFINRNMIVIGLNSRQVAPNR
jgi:protein phosphatase methylesterase 1